MGVSCLQAQNNPISDKFAKLMNILQHKRIMTVKRSRNQGWPVAFTGGICHRYLPAWTILLKVAFTGIYKYFIDFSSNYIVDSPSYSLCYTWTP